MSLTEDDRTSSSSSGGDFSQSSSEEDGPNPYAPNDPYDPLTARFTPPDSPTPPPTPDFPTPPPPSSLPIIFIIPVFPPVLFINPTNVCILARGVTIDGFWNPPLFFRIYDF